MEENESFLSLSRFFLRLETFVFLLLLCGSIDEITLRNSTIESSNLFDECLIMRKGSQSKGEKKDADDEDACIDICVSFFI